MESKEHDPAALRVLSASQHGKRRVAEHAFNLLVGVLSRAGEEWDDAGRLRVVLQDNRSAITQELLHHQGLVAAIFEFRTATPGLLESEIGWDHPVAARNVAGLLQLVLGDLDVLAARLGRSNEFRSRVERLIEELGARFVLSVQSQAERLCAAVDQLVQRVDGLHLGGARVFALELPIGNSIPIALLEHQLHTRGRSIEHVTVSLSRNDARSHGRTRGEGLRHQLQQAGVARNDLVVWIDEWNTGVNFRIVSQLLGAIARRDGFFMLPAALVAEEAPGFPRYAKFCALHDRIADALGIPGAALRFSMPRASVYPMEHPFFWSEDDRTAGYRKLQIYGSMLSLLDENLVELEADPKALRVALAAALVDPEPRVWEHPGVLEHSMKGAERLFSGWLAEYRALHPHLSALNHEGSPSCDRTLEESTESVGELGRLLEQSRGAKMCWLLVEKHMEHKRQLAPSSTGRFRFLDRTPDVIRLEGDQRRLHDAVLTALTERIWR